MGGDEAMHDEVRQAMRVVMVADGEFGEVAFGGGEVRCARAACGTRAASACSSRVSCHG